MTRRSALARNGRRWLYLVHRWIGIASCLFFAMWFVSGLVMLYVPYPSLSPAERLARAEPIDWTAVTTRFPGDGDSFPRAVSLEMRDGAPVWRVDGWNGDRDTVAARAGDTLAVVDAGYAARVAGRFGGAPAAQVERVIRDQWTVAGGFDRHRPLWRVRLADAAQTELYVSSTTGTPVQSTTATARFWNWLGSVPHWLYPTILRQDNAVWRQVVMWVSGPCIAAAVAGLWIGMLRTRLGARRFKGGRVSPYRGWMLWHHVAGLVGGGFLIAWIFSGWLSVDPGHLFRSPDPDQAAVRRYAASDTLRVPDPQRLRVAGARAVRVSMTDFATTPLVVIEYPDGTRVTLDPRSLLPSRTTRDAIVTASRALQGGAPLVALDRLTTPDAYLYEAGRLPRLPVLRLRFADAASTWLYVDPDTGEILATIDRRRRAYRWAFDLLHKWDLGVLTLHRPLWDVALWVLSLLGLVISVSGIWLGWRRLRR